MPAAALPDRSVAVVLGTRPEAVKLARLVTLLGPAALVVHTGQHYDPALAADVHASVGLRDADVLLEVGGVSRSAQIAAALNALDEEFARDRPSAVVVQGDTNTVLAGALAANAHGIALFHVEAGLRSFDRAMPEEHNRVLTDHLADWCGAPTEISRANLLAEGVDDARIEVTGNTVVEAVQSLLPDPDDRRALCATFGLEGRFVLSTFHRPENVDDAEPLELILRELGSVGVPVVLPVHPRTRARIESFGLGELLDALHVVDPLPPKTFLALAAEAACWASDSGGLQEEASVLKRPVLVVRRSTERPEVEGTFSRRLEPSDGIAAALREWLDDLPAVHAHLAELPSPYGDGTASARTLAAIERAVLR